MSLHSWLQNLRWALMPRQGQRHHRRCGWARAATYRPNLEVLEDRLTPSFSLPTSFPVGAWPAAVVTADFNNDGKLDLATANNGGGTVSVLLGNGDGTFPTALTFATGCDPRSLAAADLNNDGKLDLATANSDNTMSVLLGNSGGTFQPPISTAILPQPLAVVAADFNGDGKMDLVYTSYGLNGGWGSVEVLQGDGLGGFVARQQYQIHTQEPTGLAVADLNADGQPDVVTANLEFTVCVLLADWDGTLSYNFDSSNLEAGSYGGDVAVGDFNSDGIPDLVVTGGYTAVNFLAGHGDGTFAAPVLSPALMGMWLAATDFNGDGRLDVLTVEWTEDYGGVGDLSLGRRDGTFDRLDYFDVGVNPTAMAIGDFNGDGRPDLAVAGTDYISGEGAVSVLLNDGWTPPPPSLRINDVTVTEGNTGTVAATFTVALFPTNTQTVTVAYATANGAATADSDYRAASGILTFAPGEFSKTITVLVNGDRRAEPNEDFSVILSSPTNATIADGHGAGTIMDDEPRISISDFTKAEGKKGQTTLFTFTVTLSVAYDQPVTMSYQTVNGTAKTSDNDYVAKTGTLTFAPGETTKTITIVVNGDSKQEANETFYLDLFGLSSNSLFTKSRGIGTILNDD
jgi:hypothetical protein